MKQNQTAIKTIAAGLFQEFMPIAMIVRNSGIVPDERIEDEYVQRWWLAKIEAEHDFGRLGELKDHTRKTDGYKMYLHRISGSDKPIMHDHSSPNASLILEGEVIEHTPIGSHVRRAGDIVYRRAEELHRLELMTRPAWTLFLTGKRIREWGFMLPDGRWMPWKAVSSTGPDGVQRYTGLDSPQNVTA